MQRWTILAALTLARMAMGVQFQSVPALGGQISAETGIGFAALGLLIGIYLLPGAVTALFGGWAGQRIGDFQTALGGLALMVLGGVAGAVASGYELQMAARFVAGTGAVALNVMQTKMAGDWFQGRADLPVAMGILVSSWPAGLALAMLGLPPLVAHMPLSVLLMLPAGFSLAVMCLLALVWRSPWQGGQSTAGGSQKARMTVHESLLIFLAGIIWGLYNVAFISAIGWVPGVLVADGASEVAAAALVSLIGWVAILSVGGGGWIARALARPDAAALGCFAASGLVLVLVSLGGGWAASPVVMIALGLAIGPAAAMVMTLPVEATRAEVRSLGMGVYMAIYYALMGIAPVLMGALRDLTGSAGAPLFAAVGLFVVCILLWGLFRRVQGMRG